MFVKLFTSFLALFSAAPLWAGYSNYNSILVGNRAAGMGGAYTALTGDSSAGAYYNPASLTWTEGTSLSTSANLYMKSDTKFARPDENFEKAAFRVNQGSIKPVPSSGATVHTFGNFAMGINIILPDFDQYTGEVESSDEVTSYLNYRDESLWVGGALALNISKTESLGFSMYYTSRTFSRSITDILESGGIATSTSEEKELSHNSLVYILGYFINLSENWTLGFSHRFPSLGISGKGSLAQSTISTDGTNTRTTETNLKALTLIPAKTTLGVAYQLKKQWATSLDVSFYDSTAYNDLDKPGTFERIYHKPIWNIQFGAEYYHRPWLIFRAGVFSNNSSHKKIPAQGLTMRQPDHIDMVGFSANVAIFISPKSSITLGGYYNGGKGESVQQTGQTLTRVDKSVQNFSFLVGNAYYF